MTAQRHFILFRRNEILFLVPEGMSFAWLTSRGNQGKRCSENPLLAFNQRGTQRVLLFILSDKVYQRSQSKWLKRREQSHWNCYFISIFLLPKQSPQRQRFYPFSFVFLEAWILCGSRVDVCLLSLLFAVYLSCSSRFLCTYIFFHSFLCVTSK